MHPRRLSFSTGLLLAFFYRGRDYGVIGASPEFPEGNCTSPGWDWTLNPEGQTPCQVAKQLTSNCNNLHFGAQGVDPGFPIDTSNDHCLCNTIIYSLVYACNGCRGMLPPTAITWGTWLSQNNCTDEFRQTRVNVTTTALHIPLPTGVDVVVPGWAFLPNISDEADAWPSQTVELMAIATAKNPAFLESTIVGPTQTASTSTSASGSGVMTSGSPSNSTAPASATKKSSNTGAIVGGVVGGLGVLAIFFLAIVLLMRHRANRPRQARNLNTRRTEPSLDPFNIPPKEERWKHTSSPEESLSTRSSEIPMVSMQERREFTASPLSRGAAIPPPVPTTPPIPLAAPQPTAPTYNTRSLLSRGESSRTVSKNPYDTRSVLSRAESTVSRNPFFHLAAAEGTLTHQHLEGKLESRSRPTSQQFESLI